VTIIVVIIMTSAAVVSSQNIFQGTDVGTESEDKANETLMV